MYQCFVRNDQESAQATAELKLGGRCKFSRTSGARLIQYFLLIVFVFDENGNDCGRRNKREKNLNSDTLLFFGNFYKLGN